ncbi:putative signal transducing protein [Candidatus Electrothrix sp.]|uniref:putative signal transducing protein n=1 Tax=Candidatus Electrothrix sp. TaxID=2170559 RepID=UPI0040561035
MKKLYAPQSEIDLAMLQSILASADITFFIDNDSFGSLHMGPSIELFNQKTILVEDEDEKEAKELLKEYLKNTYDSNTPHVQTTILDKIRVVAETLLVGWFIPGRRWRAKQTTSSDSQGK